MSNFGLDLKEFERLFPFFFTLNKQMQIQSKGKSLQKICPEDLSFENCFTLIEPHTKTKPDFDFIIRNQDVPFTIGLNLKKGNACLTGEFLYSESNDLLIFCGTLLPDEHNVFESHQLNKSDFAIRESTVSNSLNKLNYSQYLEELEKQKDFFESALHNMPAEVCIFDPDLRFRFINKNAIKDKNLREWLVGKSEEDYWNYRNLPIENAEYRINLLKQAIAERDIVTFQDLYNEGSENEKAVLRSIYPHFENDELKHLLVYGGDVTLLKKGSDELEQKNIELQKLNADLDKFVYSASHDLRSPILSIQGLVDQIALSVESDPDLMQYVNYIRRVTNRLDDTIKDILNYSKNSRTEVEFTEINIGEIVRDSFENVKFYLMKEVGLEIAIDSTSVFYSDGVRINALVNNLISNAFKYSREAPEGSYIRFKAEITKEQMVFSVEDNGEGIAPEQQAKVFNMFYRVSHKASGSGLGLYICNEIVKKLEGTISLNSIPGKGTVFTVVLPNNINTEGDEI